VLGDLLASGRAAAEALMVDQCRIRRRVGETTGPGGVVTPAYEVLYEGRCRVQQSGGQAAAVEAGEARLLLLRLEVQVPMSVTGLQPADEVLMVASAHDPDLPGRQFRIRDLAHKTHATSRRLQVEEVTS